MSTVKILVGDVRHTLAKLPDSSVHCCVTSPPYWGLRDYGNDAQIGLERTPEEYVAQMVAVFREVRRVLRDDGTLWLNLGDSYANNGATDSSKVGGFTGQRIRDGAKGIMDSRPRAIPSGLKLKDLVGIPWRVAFALQADGWWLRQDIIWHKPSPMPESVTDRCTKAHEYVFLLTKRERYFYDAEAVNEEAICDRKPGQKVNTTEHYGANNGGNGGLTGLLQRYHDGDAPTRRNRRSVWTITTKPCKEAHFAVMPPDLAEPCILAGTSAEGCCAACGAPWERMVERERVATGPGKDTKATGDSMIDGKQNPERHVTDVRTIGWKPTCTCDAAKVPCTVLDPFGGAGTTGLVAQLHERNAILCELNTKYAKIAKRRIQGANPMFTTVEVVQ